MKHLACAGRQITPPAGDYYLYCNTTGKYITLFLFNGYALGQISWLVHIQALRHGNMV